MSWRVVQSHGSDYHVRLLVLSPSPSLFGFRLLGDTVANQYKREGYPQMKQTDAD